jgi:ketosteroid isomerase-like protein
MRRPTATPSATPQPSATERPEARASVSPAANESPIVSKLKAMEQEWEASLIKHDTTAIERMVADDFIGTSSSGKVGDKSTMLASARGDKSVYTSATSQDMSVHLFGSQVAVVVGTAQEKGKDSAGRAFSHTYHFTDTWVERNGEWQCVAAHAMSAPKK